MVFTFPFFVSGRNILITGYYAVNTYPPICALLLTQPFHV